MGRGFVVKSLPCGSVRGRTRNSDKREGTLGGYGQTGRRLRWSVVAAAFVCPVACRGDRYGQGRRQAFFVLAKTMPTAPIPQMRRAMSTPKARAYRCLRAHGEAGNGASDVSDQINGGNDVRRVSIGFRQKQTEASGEAHARCHAEGSGCRRKAANCSSAMNRHMSAVVATSATMETRGESPERMRASTGPPNALGAMESARMHDPAIRGGHAEAVERDDGTEGLIVGPYDPGREICRCGNGEDGQNGGVYFG